MNTDRLMIKAVIDEDGLTPLRLLVERLEAALTQMPHAPAHINAGRLDRPHPDVAEDANAGPAETNSAGQDGGVAWNQWAPDALNSPHAPAHLVEAYNRWQPDHLKIPRRPS